MNTPVPTRAGRPMLAAKPQKGVSMIEYALLAALIAVVAIVAITQVGTKVNAKFNEIQNKL